MEVDPKPDSFDVNKPYEKIMLNTDKNDEEIQCDICLEFDYED